MESRRIERLNEQSCDVEVILDEDELRVYIRSKVGLAQEALKAAETLVYESVPYTEGYYGIKVIAAHRDRGLPERPQRHEERLAPLLGRDRFGRDWGESETTEGFPEIPRVILDELRRWCRPDNRDPKVPEAGE